MTAKELRPPKPARLGKRAKAWRTYEEATAYMLAQAAHRFGIKNVKGKQTLRGVRSGTDWEIDAQARRVADDALIIVECRRKTTSRMNQEALAAIAYRISDTGAGGAITVSPYPLQKGAAKVAAAEGIEHVVLRADSTPDQWAAEIRGMLNLGFTDRAGVGVTDSLEITVRDATTGHVIDVFQA